MIAQKAYVLFSNTTIDSPDKIIGAMKTSSFAGHMELKKYVIWAKGQFDAWKKTTPNANP